MVELSMLIRHEVSNHLQSESLGKVANTHPCLRVLFSLVKG